MPEDHFLDDTEYIKDLATSNYKLSLFHRVFKFTLTLHKPYIKFLM